VAGLNPARIKPRFLFQSASSKAEKAEKEPKKNNLTEDEVDEEAETDIDVEERPQSRSSSIVITHKSHKKTSKRPAVSRMTPDSDDEVQAPPKTSSFKARLAASSAASRKRLSGSKALFDDGEDESWHPPVPKAAELSDEETAPPKRGVKRGLDIGLDTPPSTRKRTRRALY
jgi:hypothetical protein